MSSTVCSLPAPSHRCGISAVHLPDVTSRRLLVSASHGLTSKLSSYRGQEQFADRADIRAIINDDATLMQHILPSLREYNLSQLLVVEHPAADGIKEHTVSSAPFPSCPQCARS